MKRILGLACAVMFLTQTAVAEPSFWFGGADAENPAEGVYFRLQSKQGDGGRLSTFRTNIELTCGDSNYTTTLGGNFSGSLVTVRRGEASFEFSDDGDVFAPGLRANVAIKFCGASGLPACVRTENGRRVRLTKFKKARVVIGVVSAGEECQAYKEFKVRLGVAQ